MNKSEKFKNSCRIPLLTVLMIGFVIILLAGVYSHQGERILGRAATSSVNITLNTLTDTVLDGYVKNGTVVFEKSCNEGDLLPSPAEIVSLQGVTFKFIGWYNGDEEVKTATSTKPNLKARWNAAVTTGAGLKNAESIFVTEIHIKNDIKLDETPDGTNMLLLTDNAVFKVSNKVKIYGENHSIAAYVTGTDTAGITQNGSPYVIFQALRDSQLEIVDLTIYGGRNNAVTTDFATLKMTNCEISRSGCSTSAGGALYVKNSKLSAIKCTFKRNVAQMGGGMFLSGASTIAVLDSCAINENRNVSSGMHGGGAIEISSSATLYLVNSTMSNNQSTEIGGAINAYNATLYVINSTISGNVTSANQNLFRYGGGIGNNGSKVRVYNSIVENNYFYNTASKKATQSDIGLYSTIADFEAYNSIIGKIYNSGNAIVISYTEPGNKNGNKEGSSTGDFYRYDEIRILAPNGTVTDGIDINSASTPAITENVIYLTNESSALSGGAYVYFNADDLSNVKLGYGRNNDEIIKVAGNPEANDKITVFKNGVERKQASIVIGALYSIPNDVEYVKVTASVQGNGTIEGYSIFSDYYRVGKEISMTAAPNKGSAFIGFYNVIDNKLEWLSNNLTYTFTIKSGKEIAIKALFAESSNTNVYFTTYGGVLTGGFVESSPNKLYSANFNAEWSTTPPTLTINNGGVFHGWYADAAFTQVATFADGNVKNYYAKILYQITYTYLDENGNNVTQNVNNPNATTYVGNTETTLSAITLRNYVFLNFCDELGNTITSIDSTSLGNRTIKAVFKQRTIDIQNSSNIDMTYNNSNQTISVSLLDSEMTYSYQWYKNGTSDENILANQTSALINNLLNVIDSGMYYCKVSASSDGEVLDYKFSAGITVTIAKADYDITGITFQNATFEYNGEEQNIQIVGNLPTGLDGIKVTVTYSGGATNVNQNGVDVTATFATTSGNYNVPATLNAILTITGRQLPSISNMANVTYNGTQQTPSFEINDGSLTTSYTVTWDDSSFVNAKTYTLTAVGTGNYQGTQTATYTIDKKLASVAVQSASKSYGEANPNFVVVAEGFLEGDDISFTADTTAGQVSNVGDYDIIVKTQETNNYSVTYTNARLTIVKADYDITGITFKNATCEYNGEEQNIQIVGNLPTGLDGIKVTVTYRGGATNVNQNGVDVTATFATTSGNYNAPASLKATLTITVKCIIITAVATETTVLTPIVRLDYTIADGALANADVLSGELVREEGVLPGEYAIKIGTLTGGENYVIDFVSAIYTIKRVIAEYDGESGDEGESTHVPQPGNGVQGTVENPDGFGNKAYLVVEIISANIADKALVTPKQYESVKTYRAQMYINDTVIPVFGDLKIRFEAPSGLRSDTKYYIITNENDEVKLSKIEIKDGFIEFTTNSLGDFAIIEENENNLMLAKVLLVIINIILFIVLMLVIVNRKNRRER